MYEVAEALISEIHSREKDIADFVAAKLAYLSIRGYDSIHLAAIKAQAFLDAEQEVVSNGPKVRAATRDTVIQLEVSANEDVVEARLEQATADKELAYMQASLGKANRQLALEMMRLRIYAAGLEAGSETD